MLTAPFSLEMAEHKLTFFNKQHECPHKTVHYNFINSMQ